MMKAFNQTKFELVLVAVCTVVAKMRESRESRDCLAPLNCQIFIDDRRCCRWVTLP